MPNILTVSLGQAEQILKDDPNSEEIIGDCYDKNKSIEYDLEEVSKPIAYLIK